ncbi:MAG: outer membrane beta-barrel protein [Methylocystis sp.]
MNKITSSLAAIALAISTGSAFAADLPSLKAPPVVVPPPPLWTGFYFGANVGGIFDASTGASISAAPLFNDTTGAALGAPSYFGAASAASIASNASLSNAGVIGGGQIGYNWQFNNSFLAGLEADIQGTTLSSNASASGAATEPSTGSLVSTTASLAKSLSYLGTVRGRLGFLATPTLLVFGSGGLAYGGMNFTAGLFQTSSNPNFPYSAVSADYNDARIGWTAGGGVEWMFAPNWSAKVEYLYYDLGTASAANALSAAVPAGNLLYGSYYQTSTHFNGQVVRVGVNYHFQWFAPATVVAKY